MADTLQKVSDFVLNSRPDDMPDEAMRWAALLTLDTLGITAGSAPMQAGVIGRDVAAALYGSAGGPDSARMLFDGRMVSSAGAAYAAATQTDNLDAHDGFNPVKGHIGVVAVPVIAVLAQQHRGLSGPEALATTVIGYEVAGRAGLSLHGTVSDYHTSGAWNALGGAAIAARLKGLSAEQLRHAFGIAEYHGPRSQMMREIANPTMLHDGSGWGALAGVSAAVLAERGFEGAPAITIEADKVVPWWADLGQYWQMAHQYVKPYPICRWAHAAIDAVGQVMQDHALTADQIGSIDVRSFAEAVALYPGMPDTTSKAQYSLRFAVAVRALYGRIGLEHISGDGLRDRNVADLIERITVTETDAHNQNFPQHRMADVTLNLRDGRALHSGDVHAHGGPETPMDEAEIVAKYMSFAAPVLGKARAAAIRDAVLGLTEPSSRYDDVVALLCDPPA